MSKADHADALCWFGCSGDLGHKMTFPALYAMARRGHLHVPIVGIAFSNWTLDDLKDRAATASRSSAVGSPTPRRGTT